MFQLEQILQEQFDLMMYLPGMTFESTESLTKMERHFFINKLKQYFEKKNASSNAASGKYNMSSFPGAV